MPKLSSGKLKLGISLRAGLSMALLLVLVLLAYMAYKSWYSNLQAADMPSSQGRVIRVNLTGYRSVIQMLDRMETFTPDTRAFEQGTPFQFRD